MASGAADMTVRAGRGFIFLDVKMRRLEYRGQIISAALGAGDLPRHTRRHCGQDIELRIAFCASQIIKRHINALPWYLLHLHHVGKKF